MTLCDSLPADQEKKIQRLDFIDAALREFCELKGSELGPSLPPVCYVPEVAKRINDTYWNLIESYVKPNLESADGGEVVRVDAHKILAGTEFAVMYVPLLRFDDENNGLPSSDVLSNRQIMELNADFAIYLTLKMFGLCFAGLSIEPIKRRDSYLREHRAWLANLETSVPFAYFLRAQVWYFIEQLCIAKAPKSRPDLGAHSK
jgi:hypothetical protein